MLSPTALASVLCRVDQPTRVSCALASKELHAALCKPGAGGFWGQVQVYAPTECAARFVELINAHDILIRADNLQAVERFMEGLDRSVPMSYVSVVVGSTCGVTWLARALRGLPVIELLVSCHGVEAAGIIFDVEMPRLRRLEIYDSSRNIEVYFQVPLPELRELSLRVAASNALTLEAPLHAVTHDVQDESYEDARFDNEHYHSLSFRVCSDVCWTYLSAALQKARSIGELVLKCSTAIDIDTALPVQELCIRPDPDVHITFSLPCVRGLRSLRVTDGSVSFVNCGTWDSFLRFTHNTEVALDCSQVTTIY